MNDIYVRRLNKFYSNRKKFAKIRMGILFAVTGILFAIYVMLMIEQIILIGR